MAKMSRRMTEIRSKISKTQQYSIDETSEDIGEETGEETPPE